MAVFQKGILGGFSGLVGTVIGSTWRTLDVLKSKPKKYKKTVVQAQIDQCLKFRLIAEFLSNLKPEIDYGYQFCKKGLTPMNTAISYHLINAVKGVSPNFTVDYAKVILSVGKMQIPSNIKVIPEAGSKLKFTWDPFLPVRLRPWEKEIRDKDNVVFIALDPLNDILYPGQVTATRGDGGFEVELNGRMKGSAVHVWLFFRSEDGKNVSGSEYFGLIKGLACCEGNPACSQLIRKLNNKPIW